MGRKVGGFFVGFLVAMVVVILCQSLNLQLYPLPEGFDPSDTEALKAHVASQPTGAFFGVLASYFFGSLAGGATATRVAKDPRAGIAVGAALMIGGFSNLTRIPHPVWFAIVSTLIYLPSAWIGSALALKRLEEDAQKEAVV